MEEKEKNLLTAKVPIAEFLESCVDVEKFLGFCKQCRNYGKIWACPPLSFDPMELWNRYDSLTLYARVLKPEPDMDFPAFLSVFKEEKTVLTRYALEQEEKTPGSLSLAASTCTACSPCLRSSGKPCCHPGQLRYSIEALGGDVGKIMEKYLHLPLKWAQQGELPEYLTVVAGLLAEDPK